MVYGRVWREVREGENAIIIISKKIMLKNVLLDCIKLYDLVL